MRSVSTRRCGSGEPTASETGTVRFGGRRLETQVKLCAGRLPYFVVLCKTKRQAERALEAVTACVEEDLGLCLNSAKTHLTTFGQGFEFLGYQVTARTIRMGGKAEERFKTKIKALTRRSHNLDAEVVLKVNRVIRGTVCYFATEFTTCLGQLNELDRWIRMRIRCMKYKRIWKSDNRRLKSRHIAHMGFTTCREVYLGAR